MLDTRDLEVAARAVCVDTALYIGARGESTISSGPIIVGDFLPNESTRGFKMSSLASSYYRECKG